MKNDEWAKTTNGKKDTWAKNDQRIKMTKFALIILNVLIFTLIQAFGSDADCWSKRPAYVPKTQWTCKEEGKFIF